MDRKNMPAVAVVMLFLGMLLSAILFRAVYDWFMELGNAYGGRKTESQKQDENRIDSFRVKYYGTYSSSAGTRVLDITYTVKDNRIVSCDGYYTARMTDATRRHKCDVNSLVGKEYNAPTNLITLVDGNQRLYGESRDGPAYSNWTILP